MEQAQRSGECAKTGEVLSISDALALNKFIALLPKWDRLAVGLNAIVDAGILN